MVPASSSPRTQTAPRWLLLPSVACSMRASPGRPMTASFSRNRWLGEPSMQFSANKAKVLRSDRAERRIKGNVRSRWAPQPRRSTRAGLGVSSASSIKAQTARLAMTVALVCIG